jgi:hypothetical protein
MCTVVLKEKLNIGTQVKTLYKISFFITEEIKRYSAIYYNRITGHENSYVTELSNPSNVRRRLKRQW